jgi:acyl dehydratase
MSQVTIYFEDANVGDTGPELRHTLGRSDLVMYAGASGDFNPLHTDDVAAREAGLPGVFGHGMFSAGLLGRALTDFVGAGNLKSYKVRFTRQTRPGEVLVATTEIVAKRVDGGDHLVDITCRLANDAGEVKVDGEAVALLPTRSAVASLPTRG